jgi:hypothetical protein
MITTLEQLDAFLGRMPAAVGLKVSDHIDAEAQRWIDASPLAFLSSTPTPRLVRRSRWTAKRRG